MNKKTINAEKTTLNGEPVYILKEEDFKDAVTGIYYKQVIDDFKKQQELNNRLQIANSLGL